HFLGISAASTVYAAHSSTGAARFELSDDAAGPFPLNTWTHVAVTYQGSVAAAAAAEPIALTIYRNGKLTATRTSTTQTWTGGLNTMIGNWGGFGMDACVTDATQ